MKLASFERKKRRQANKKARKKRKKRERGSAWRQSARMMTTRKMNWKMAIPAKASPVAAESGQKAAESGNKKNERKKGDRSADVLMKQKQRFCRSELVRVLWCDKYYSCDIVTDHGNGKYAVLYTNFESSNYEDSVDSKRIKKIDLKPTKKDLATNLKGRRVPCCGTAKQLTLRCDTGVGHRQEQRKAHGEVRRWRGNGT